MQELSSSSRDKFSDIVGPRLQNLCTASIMVLAIETSGTSNTTWAMIIVFVRLMVSPSSSQASAKLMRSCWSTSSQCVMIILLLVNRSQQVFNICFLLLDVQSWKGFHLIFFNGNVKPRCQMKNMMKQQRRINWRVLVQKDTPVWHHCEFQSCLIHYHHTGL